MNWDQISLFDVWLMICCNLLNIVSASAQSFKWTDGAKIHNSSDFNGGQTRKFLNELLNWAENVNHLKTNKN